MGAKEDGIPVTLICDGMAGISMRRIDPKVIVGADRIALNGILQIRSGHIRWLYWQRE